jgi:hypothetical protein
MQLRQDVISVLATAFAATAAAVGAIVSCAALRQLSDVDGPVVVASKVKVPPLLRLQRFEGVEPA